MRSAELLSLVYFLFLPLAGRLEGSQRHPRRADVLSAGLAAAAAALQLLGEGPATGRVRDWAPAAFLLLAYWMSGAYIGGHAPLLEGWLLHLDRRLLGTPLRFTAERAPRAVLEALEAAYITCYPFVPAGLVWLELTGHGAQADRFWTAVLAAALPCYALLPWLHTRPPRLVETDLPIDRRGLAARRFNLLMLWHTSVHANTFPSAHVSSTLAAALTVAATLPWAGAGFLALAAAIAVSTVVGRYHYGADAVLGVLLGVAGFLLGQRV